MEAPTLSRLDATKGTPLAKGVSGLVISAQSFVRFREERPRARHYFPVSGFVPSSVIKRVDKNFKSTRSGPEKVSGG